MPNRYFVPIAQHLLGELFDSEAFCKGNRMRSLEQPSSTKSNLSNHHTSHDIEKDTKLLKQDQRKLEDQHRRQEKILRGHRSIRQANSIFIGTISSTNNSIDIYDQRMGHSPVLSKPRQYLLKATVRTMAYPGDVILPRIRDSSLAEKHNEAAPSALISGKSIDNRRT
ncbi:hypothetical protein TGAM01_v208008 [Trichoderma gamsii]|uniref:Uncharacterized protein n=1 Tax=Trichoderma gamsii TaxID=398673 RepID=A0A2P4ZFG3_9HYPO|nr:hypothetical protein TGAM01_v208008 [Trichoderma gamsii]PON23003.1 hypothetical protein TGAM01_v208008 [Trichoderma gamsii]